MMASRQIHLFWIYGCWNCALAAQASLDSSNQHGSEYILNKTITTAETKILFSYFMARPNFLKMPFCCIVLLNWFRSVCLCRDVFLTRSNLEVLRMFILRRPHGSGIETSILCHHFCNGAARSNPSSSSLIKADISLSLSLSLFLEGECPQPKCSGC